jgi:hypothetical protein
MRPSVVIVPEVKPKLIPFMNDSFIVFSIQREILSPQIITTIVYSLRRV